MKNPTPKVDCSRGAPLGRFTGASDPGAQGKFYLRHVPLDSGGYDAGGAYWGFGAPLYWFMSADQTAEGFLRLNTARRSQIAQTMRNNGDDPLEFGARALDRRTIKAQIWDNYPNAQFFN
jgi:hypothetical protein